MKIGEVTERLDISIDTVRYYEKIGLLKDVGRSAAGQREFTDGHLATLRFIKSAQKMGFSLDDIGNLLTFRANPKQSKPKIRALVMDKLEELNKQLIELQNLKDELTALTLACHATDASEPTRDDCPILDSFDKPSS